MTDKPFGEFKCSSDRAVMGLGVPDLRRAVARGQRRILVRPDR